MASIYAKGVAHFKIDGVPYSNDVDGGFEIKIQNTKKETLVASDGQLLYSQKPQPSSISGKLLVKPETDLSKLIDATNVTVTVQTFDGQVYGLRNAVYVGDASFSSSDGQVSVSFEGIGYFG